MRHFISQMSPQRHQQIIDEVREAGKQGATRVPDTIMFGNGDPSDSMVIRMTDALLEGQADREKQEQAV